jgi:N-acetylmuramoyl-L-alanine amidase
MARHLVGPALVLALLCGCAEEVERISVLQPLPPPHYLAYAADPAPRTLTTLPAEPPKKDPHEAWRPPGALYSGWEYIVIHHSATPYGSLRDIDRWHHNNGWENGCGYHFVIGNGTHSPDGLVEPSHRWAVQDIGAHTRLSPQYARRTHVPANYYNEHGIGVVLVGNLEECRPTAGQMNSLAQVVSFLMDACRISEDRIVGHGQVDQTECPGRFFSMADLKRRVRAIQYPETAPAGTASTARPVLPQ